MQIIKEWTYLLVTNLPLGKLVTSKNVLKVM